MGPSGNPKGGVGAILAAALLFAQIAGVALVGARTACAAPAHASWHAVEAPGDLVSLSDYLLQPPDGGLPKGEVEKEDTTEDVPSTEPLNPPVPPPSSPRNFGASDTTGRADSMLTFPSTQSAPMETIGAQSFIPAAGSSAKAAPSKRGILGLHPAALIIALVAAHIVVVGLVSK